MLTDGSDVRKAATCRYSATRSTTSVTSTRRCRSGTGALDSTRSSSSSRRAKNGSTLWRSSSAFDEKWCSTAERVMPSSSAMPASVARS